MIMFVSYHKFGGHSWLKGEAADSLPLVRVGHSLVPNDQPLTSGLPKVPDVPPPKNVFNNLKYFITTKEYSILNPKNTLHVRPYGAILRSREELMTSLTNPLQRVNL